MELMDKINKLKEKLVMEQENTVNMEKWIELIEQFTHPTELSVELLNALIEKLLCMKQSNVKRDYMNRK